MSVQTYNELRAQLKRWTRRQDIDDIFDTAIELVENEIYAGKSPLRVKLKTGETSLYLIHYVHDVTRLQIRLFSTRYRMMITR